MSMDETCLSEMSPTYYYYYYCTTPGYGLPLFIWYDSFNDAVSSSNNIPIASNDVDRSGRSRIYGSTLVLACGDRGKPSKTSVKLAILWIEI
jgi:hypothetical protein